LKYLVAGLGNIGDDYKNTRHNIGFMVLDAWVESSNISFIDGRYGSTATIKHKGRTFVLLKPSTFMNLSGNAIGYWLKKEKISVDNFIVVVDDISIPLGSIRIRPKGGDGGHNGLAHINSILGSGNYPRIRFGIGDDFSRGQQVDYVLGDWSEKDLEILKPRIDLTIEMIKSFGFIGLELTMTKYNKLGKADQESPNE
jgi:PTH1 family peptidyl-tRNA hydrolase